MACTKIISILCYGTNGTRKSNSFSDVTVFVVEAIIFDFPNTIKYTYHLSQSKGK